MNGSKLRFFAPLGAKKERDEELALFRELFKREREKNMNLLESVSTDIEPIEGNSTVFKISTGKMGDSLTNDGEKNDYDWLKTPPATPLFQSLEMDVVQANAAINTTVHKELPIIPPLKPSRFSSKIEEPKQLPKSPSSPLISSLSSSSSFRNEISDMQILSPPKIILTPRLRGVQDSLSSRMTSTLRFNRIQDPCIKGPYEEAPPKPVQTQRLVSKNAESKSRPKSPSSSRPSTAASSRPETPETNANMNQKCPPSRVKVDRTVISRGKMVSNSTTKRLSKEVPIKQAQGTKLQTPRFKTDPNKPRPVLPSSRPVTSASSRPETPDPNPDLKTKAALKNPKPKPKPTETPIEKSNREATAKQNSNPKSNSQTVSRFPATTLPEFPDEAPPNLITSVASGRPTSATRSRPAVTGSSETKRSPSVTKQITATESGDGGKGNEKRGTGAAVVLGSSMVNKMLNARRSEPPAMKAAGKEEKGPKVRGF